MVKVIAAGSRFDERESTLRASRRVSMWQALDDFDLAYGITEIVSGTARGADRLGEQWALARGVPVKRFPADWDGLGKRAGYVRNREMAKYAGALVAQWDYASPGTKNMVDEARRLGLTVVVVRV